MDATFDKLLALPYGYYKKEAAYPCDRLYNEIRLRALANTTIADAILDQVLAKFMQKHNEHWPCCTLNHKNKVADMLNMVMTYYVPKEEILSLMIAYVEFDKCIELMIRENKNFTGFSMITINSFLLNRLDVPGAMISEVIVDYVMDRITSNLTREMFLLVSSCRNEYGCNRLKAFVDKYDDKEKPLIPSVTVLHNVCAALPYSKKLFSAIYQFGERHGGIVLDSTCLSIVCEFGDSDSIRYFLDVTRMPVSSEHLQQVGLSKVFATRALNYMGSHSQINTYRACTEPKIISDKIETLIQYGYMPTYEDVVTLTLKKVEIPGLSRFDHIKCDQKLFHICHANQFYPTSYRFTEPLDMTLHMLELLIMCNNRESFPIVKRHINLHKLIPNQYCLENVALSGLYNAPSILEYFVKKGAKVSYVAITNCFLEETPKTSKLKCLRFLMDKYKEQMQGDIDKYRLLTLEKGAKVEELEKTVSELRASIAAKQEQTVSQIQVTITVNQEEKAPVPVPMLSEKANKKKGDRAYDGIDDDDFNDFFKEKGLGSFAP